MIYSGQNVRRPGVKTSSEQNMQARDERSWGKMSKGWNIHNLLRASVTVVHSPS